MTEKIKVPYHKQSKEHTCGPASMKMILQYQGIIKSEEELEAEMNTTETEGTSYENLITLAQKSGMEVEAKSMSELSDVYEFIDKDIPVIVNYKEQEADEGHYAIITGYTDSEVTLNDPWHGEIKINNEEFIQRWKNNSETVLRWMMAVHKKSPEIIEASS